jgi:hypothetical protein
MGRRIIIRNCVMAVATKGKALLKLPKELPSNIVNLIAV